MKLFHRHELKKGPNRIASPRKGLLRYITLDILKLRRGDAFDLRQNEKEAVAVLLTGKVDVRMGDKSFGQLLRKDIWSGRASTLFVPAGQRARLKAAYDSEIALVQAPGKKGIEPYIVRPEDVVVRVAGTHNWRRDVHTIIGPAQPSKHLLVGETFNPPGNWSSYPPHRHQKDDVPHEVAQEEVYFFRLKPEQGFAFQRIYDDARSIDEVHTIVNNASVVLPRGYHPVAAAPGYALYYLWILAGKIRLGIPRDDPDHAWVHHIQSVVDSL